MLAHAIPDPSQCYGRWNILRALAWACRVYFLKSGLFKYSGINMELWEPKLWELYIFPKLLLKDNLRTTGLGAVPCQAFNI